MIKNAAALVLAASLGATTAIGTQELLSDRKDIAYRAHGFELRRSQVDDKSAPTAFAYVDALMAMADGGVGFSDLSGHPCDLPTAPKEVQACITVLFDYGATPACR